MPKHQDRLSSFAVIAEKDGIEIRRCRVDALDEDDARVDGIEELSDKDKTLFFDETVSYRVVKLNA